MIQSASEDFKFVIGIDFGTSRSGYATGSRLDGVVHLPQRWEDQDVPYIKTPTELLYSPERTVKCWGASTRKQLARLRKGNEARNYSRFDKFKMRIYNGNGQGFRWPDGSEVSVPRIIADYLRCLKEHALAAVRQSTTSPLEQDSICWVLTVPAIWGDTQKEIMRRAAVEAGIIGPGDSDRERLLFVLEPEAAAVYCQSLKSLNLNGQRPGTRFMVVDAGGGTVDITVHEITPEKGLKEVVQGDGGPYGSMYVDREFMKYLMQRLSPDALDAFRDEEPVAWIYLMDCWEITKCGYRPQRTADDSEITYFDLGGKLISFLRRSYPDVLQRLAAVQQGVDDTLEISDAMMRGFFAPVLDGIVEKVQAVFSRLNDRRCEFILLVGGLAKSPLLQERLAEEFSGRAMIVIPPDPSAAVVAGATHYGLAPSVIRERRSRLTYGCNVAYPFESGHDPEKKKIVDTETNNLLCADRFAVFVHAGESVPVDQPRVQVFLPVHPDQRTMKFQLFATKRRDPRYVDEQGVQKLGVISLDLPSGSTSRKVQLKMFFGRAEVEVEARHVESGKKISTRLDFSSTYLVEHLGG